MGGYGQGGRGFLADERQKYQQTERLFLKRALRVLLALTLAFGLLHVISR